MGGLIRIEYRRPPDRVQLFEQRLVARLGVDDDEAIVTLLERAGVSRPVVVHGRPVLEADSPVVWFTYPGRWHDIGRFHDAAGAFTGYYANVLTPVQGVEGGDWRTTDLFLDVWLSAEGGPAVTLDEDELSEAESNGWLDASAADTARREAVQLAEWAGAGDWPPAAARAWTLERARAALDDPAPGG